MNHRRTYMHINFQQNWVSRSVKTVHTNLFAQYRKLHKFATTNSNFEENQSFWTCIIIKHTCISIFSKIKNTSHDRAYKFIRKKIASCINLQLRIIIFQNRLFQTCIIVKRTCTSIFSKIGLVDQSKPCTQIYLQKIANCINLQLAIRISKNQAFRTCTTPSRTFRPILSSIGLLGNELPRKEIISTDGRTDRRTDGQTDGQTSRTTTIGSFFEKRKNY